MNSLLKYAPQPKIVKNH